MTEKIFNEKRYIEIGEVEISGYQVGYFYNREGNILRASLCNNHIELKGALIWFSRNLTTLELNHINSLNKLLDIPKLNNLPGELQKELI